MRFTRAPWYKFAFVLFLAVPQLIAFYSQFASGFRPFVQEPTRVPLSWDMFANRMERCRVEWTPTIYVGPRALSALRDVQLSLEWDIIFDHREDYRGAASWFCQNYAVSPTRVQLHCFLPQGEDLDDGFSCP